MPSFSLTSPLGYLFHALVWLWAPKHESVEHTSDTDSDFYCARPNQLLCGRYRVFGKLGGGVYSTTYLVSDESNG